MKIPVFLSISTPFNDDQRDFRDKLKKSLKQHGFDPRTLGDTDYDTNAPLAGCRRLMLECNGLICLAFRRNEIVKGIPRPGKEEEDKLDGKWLTSEFCQIEPAMAYQLGLPILIFTEKDVYEKGVLEREVVGQYMPTFDLDDKTKAAKYFRSVEYTELLKKWGHNVETVWNRKGNIDRF